MFQPLSRLLLSYFTPAAQAPRLEPTREPPVSLLEKLPLAVIQNELLAHVTDPADRHALARVERALWPVVRDHVSHNHLRTVHMWLCGIVDHTLPQSYAEVIAGSQNRTLSLNWGDAARATDYLLFSGPLGRIGYDARTHPAMPLDVAGAESALHAVSIVMRRAAARGAHQTLADVVSPQDITATRDHLFDLRELAYLPLDLYEKTRSATHDDSEAKMLSDISHELKNLTSRNEKSWRSSYSLLGSVNFPPLHLYLPKLEQLSLSGSGLTALPAELAHLPHLTSLDAQDNQLAAWAPGAPSLPHLTHLYLARNTFKEFPEGLLDCSALTHLSLSQNSITQIPETVVRLTRLQAILVDNNQITRLPQAISSFDHLEILDVSQNPL